MLLSSFTSPFFLSPFLSSHSFLQMISNSASSNFPFLFLYLLFFTTLCHQRYAPFPLPRPNHRHLPPSTSGLGTFSRR